MYSTAYDVPAGHRLALVDARAPRPRTPSPPAPPPATP
ncbi:hypothetical protein ABT116_12000 [Streptomyces sp. NPDC002130]